MKDFINKLDNFKINCCSPRSAYDWDGLTWQELICNVFKGVNECIEFVNTYTEIIREIMKWISNEGLEQEVKKGLDKFIEDGTISEIINGEIFGNIQNKLEELSKLIEDNKNDIVGVKEEIESLKNEILEEVKATLLKITNRVEKLENTPQPTEIYVFKNAVDYGDCSVIKADDGSYSMIDCMWETNWGTLSQQLDKVGVDKLKYLFITHFHSDHIGNAPTIINKYKPEFIVYKSGIDFDRLPEVEKEWDTKGYFERMIKACKDNNVTEIIANDQEIKIGINDTVQLFASHFYDYTNLNAMSVNYMLKSKGVKAVFPGDSAKSTELAIKDKVGKVDWLKLSHHGADGGNSDDWFNALKPEFGVINRVELYKLDIVKSFALKCIKFGGSVYTNDNNDFCSFRIVDGAIYPTCKEYKFPLQFLDYWDGTYKMTDTTGKIATKGIYPYKTDYYFVKDNGFIAQKEWINYHGVDYYADSAGRLVRNTFIEGTDNGHPVWYWINEKCEMVLDWTFVNYRNNLYIIKANGMMCDEMIVEYQGDHYRATKGGPLLLNDWFQDGSDWYYFRFDGRMIKNKTIVINGKWYTFGADGKCSNPDGEPIT